MIFALFKKFAFDSFSDSMEQSLLHENSEKKEVFPFTFQSFSKRKKTWLTKISVFFFGCLLLDFETIEN